MKGSIQWKSIGVHYEREQLKSSAEATSFTCGLTETGSSSTKLFCSVLSQNRVVKKDEVISSMTYSVATESTRALLCASGEAEATAGLEASKSTLALLLCSCSRILVVDCDQTQFSIAKWTEATYDDATLSTTNTTEHIIHSAGSFASLFRSEFRIPFASHAVFL